jgi:hypothetical protein
LSFSFWRKRHTYLKEALISMSVVFFAKCGFFLGKSVLPLDYETDDETKILTL